MVNDIVKVQPIKELKRVELTAEEMKVWENTTTAFLWHCPAFSHIFYNILNRVGSRYEAVFTYDIPVAATDGKAVAFNPKTFLKNYNLFERVFIFNHEIIHCILNHNNTALFYIRQGFVAYDDGTKLPYIHKLMGWANDYVINDTLVNSKQGKLPSDGLWDTNMATWQEHSSEAYRKIYKQEKAAGRLPKKGFENVFFIPGEGNQPEPGSGGKVPFDVLLMPGSIEGKEPTTAALERNDSEWRTVCETAHQIAKLRGTMPAGLERLFTEELEPHVPWGEHVQTIIARTLGSDGYNWRRPDRRLIIRDIYAPGRTGHAAKLIVVGSDTSGSINGKTLDMWYAELAGIFEELKPAQLVIMWCDAGVHDVDWCDEPGDLNVIRKRGVRGGGGTSFIPVFDKIDELGLEPDALIYLTDGYGSFPEVEPAYPVIWGTIGLDPDQYPFGEAVAVPEQV